jgi:S1-C subfamily serine protease
MTNFDDTDPNFEASSASTPEPAPPAGDPTPAGNEAQAAPPVPEPPTAPPSPWWATAPTATPTGEPTSAPAGGEPSTAPHAAPQEFPGAAYEAPYGPPRTDLPPSPWWATAPTGQPNPAPVPPAHAPAPRRRAQPVLGGLLVAACAVGGVAIGRATASNKQNPAVASQPFAPPSQPSNGSNGSNGSDGSDGGGVFQNPFGDNGNGNGSNSDGGSSTGGTGGGASSATQSSVAAKVSPAVVNINTTLDGGAAAGTGMIITSDGEVLTNNHVIADSTSISVQLSDGSSHSAKVLGYDVTDDVALIKVNGVSNLPTISTANLSSVAVGNAVVAIGNALGKGGSPTVVTGSVTAVDQTITASDGTGQDAETLHHLIQTDAPIQPGDSGGPLSNTDGKVIGMDTAASTNSGFGFRNPSAGASQGFAIPIGNALTIAKQIESSDASATVHIGERGILGVAVQSGSGSNGFFGGGSSNGVSVTQVESGSGADKAGMQTGDTIVAINGTTVSSESELQQAMNGYHPNDHVKVTWLDSNGSQHSATITLEAGPPA